METTSTKKQYALKVQHNLQAVSAQWKVAAKSKGEEECGVYSFHLPALYQTLWGSMEGQLPFFPPRWQVC